MEYNEKAKILLIKSRDFAHAFNEEINNIICEPNIEEFDFFELNQFNRFNVTLSFQRNIALKKLFYKFYFRVTENLELEFLKMTKEGEYYD